MTVCVPPHNSARIVILFQNPEMSQLKPRGYSKETTTRTLGVGPCILIISATKRTQSRDFIARYSLLQSFYAMGRLVEIRMVW